MALLRESVYFKPCLFKKKKQLNTIFARHTGFRPGSDNNERIVSYTDVKNEV